MTTQLNFVLVLFWARPLLPEEDEDYKTKATSRRLSNCRVQSDDDDDDDPKRFYTESLVVVVVVVVVP